MSQRGLSVNRESCVRTACELYVAWSPHLQCFDVMHHHFPHVVGREGLCTAQSSCMLPPRLLPSTPTPTPAPTPAALQLGVGSG